MIRKILILLALLFLGFFAIFLWVTNGLKPVAPQDYTTKMFVIKNGNGIREVAANLKKQGLIKNPIVFFLFIKTGGYDTKIQAGDFRLSPSMSIPQLVETLSHGTIDIWITIPEGLRSEEIADIFKKQFAQYDNSWKALFIKNNGYLFPDTYLIPKDADINLIIQLMKNNFYKKVADIGLTQDSANFSKIVIIASLIEREAKYPEDRTLVSSVIHNRLKVGMKLDIDATVQYILGDSEKTDRWWKKNLTHEDLAIDSPYNTYKYATLPPTPISNPGLSSLKAAAQPSETDYFYYVSDTQGHLHFAKTLTQHQQNISTYIR